MVAFVAPWCGVSFYVMQAVDANLKMFYSTVNDLRQSMEGLRKVLHLSCLCTQSTVTKRRTSSYALNRCVYFSRVNVLSLIIRKQGVTGFPTVKVTVLISSTLSHFSPLFGF